MNSIKMKKMTKFCTSKMTKAAIRLLFLSILLSGTTALLAKGGGPNVAGAKLYIQQNELEKAHDVLMKEIKERNANNEDAWYLLGYIYARQKQYDKMLEAMDKAAKLKPKFIDKGIKIRKDKGAILSSGDVLVSSMGIEMMKRAVWRNAFNSAVSLFNAAGKAADDSTRSANYIKASENFQVAGIIIPDSVLSFKYCAWSLINLGREDESVEPLETGLKYHPDNVELRSILAQVYATTGKDSLALPILEDLWHSGNHSEEIAEHLSRLYVNSGRTVEAKAIYKSALEDSPNNFKFRLNYGVIFLQASEFDNAIEQLKTALSLDTLSYEVNYYLGVAYLNKGVAIRDQLPENSEDESYKENFKLSLPYLEKAIAMNPDDSQTWLTLGRIAGQLNNNTLAGYAFSKSDLIRTALDNKVVVGMQSSLLKTIFGEPDQITPIDSKQFSHVEEWVYKERAKAKGKIAISKQVNIYINKERVESIFIP
ncbi:MAG: tetratricopeptide repeat protein [bacterium]